MKKIILILLFMLTSSVFTSCENSSDYRNIPASFEGGAGYSGGAIGGGSRS